MMTYEEFRKEAIRLLRQHIKDEEYIAALDDDIKKHYESEKSVSELLGNDQISPGGYALGIFFMYPDLP